MGLRTIAERIADTKKERLQYVDGMQTVLDLAETEERTFTEDEAVKFEDGQKQVKALDGQIERLEAMQETVKKSATFATDGGSYEVPTITERPRIEVHRNLPPGIAFTRYAIALMVCKGMLADAENFAKNRWGESTPEVSRMIKTAQLVGGPGALLKAVITPGTTTDPTFAGPLVEYATAAGEFIDLLRPATIIGQIPGFRSVPFNVRIPRQVAGAVAQWVGEGKPKPVSKPGFDAITIPWAKVAVIVVITEELARFSSPSAEALVRNDMVAAISAFINQQFIDPAVTGTPGLSPPSVTNAGVLTPSTGATVAQVMADVGGMQARMAAAEVSGNTVWVMNPRTKINLSMLRTAQDVYAFPELAAGTFRGSPVVASNQVPIDGTAKTIMVLMAPNEVLLADDGGVTLDTSNEASLDMNSAPATPPAAPLTSLWQNNLLGIRAERYIYWMLRSAAAVQVLTQVAY